MKRGTIKAFRKYLNEKYGFEYANWRNNKYRQINRQYGDYLYFQDRPMFDQLLADALAGKGHCKDFSV